MQNKPAVFIGAIVLLAAALGAGYLAYDFVLGDTEAASGPVTAIPVALGASTPTSASAATEPAPGGETAAPTEAAPTAESAPQTASVVILQIVGEESEARFSIYEELGGQPKTVVGVTNQVAGEIAVDLNDLARVQVGVIQVNARTFVTDSEQRNRAIRNRILQTDAYEFITFRPTAVIGLNGPAAPGQPYTFQVAGDLTIRDITQPVVFDVTVQADSSERLSGTATTVVTRSAFNLVIPSVPNVANVGEEVTLEIDFVAEAPAG